MLLCVDNEEYLNDTIIKYLMLHCQQCTVSWNNTIYLLLSELAWSFPCKMCFINVPSIPLL